MESELQKKNEKEKNFDDTRLRSACDNLSRMQPNSSSAWSKVHSNLSGETLPSAASQQAHVESAVATRHAGPIDNEGAIVVWQAPCASNGHIRGAYRQVSCTARKLPMRDPDGRARPSFVAVRRYVAERARREMICLIPRSYDRPGGRGSPH